MKLFTASFEILRDVMFAELILDKFNILVFTKGMLIGNIVGVILGIILWFTFLKKKYK